MNLAEELAEEKRILVSYVHLFETTEDSEIKEQIKKFILNQLKKFNGDQQ